MEPILIPFIVFATFFGIAYLFFTTRNKERLALIEKGETAAIFNNEGNRYVGLKIGIAFIGVSIGILLGYLHQSLPVASGTLTYILKKWDCFIIWV